MNALAKLCRRRVATMDKSLCLPEAQASQVRRQHRKLHLGAGFFVPGKALDRRDAQPTKTGGSGGGNDEHQTDEPDRGVRVAAHALDHSHDLPYRMLDGEDAQRDFLAISRSNSEARDVASEVNPERISPNTEKYFPQIPRQHDQKTCRQALARHR